MLFCVKSTLDVKLSNKILVWISEISDMIFKEIKVHTTTRSYSKRVVDIPNVGFYSLPKIMGRTGRFIYDGLRLISLGFNTKTKNTNIVQKPKAVLVAVCHFPPSHYSFPVGSSGE